MTRSPKACPFCGHPTPSALEIDRNHWSITCPQCEATGPTSTVGLAYAVDLWNDRIPHRPPQPRPEIHPALLCCGED